MAYSTSSDVETAVGGAARLLQLTDRDGDGVYGAEDAAVVAAAIAEADALIDSYASKRFATPFATPPTTIVKLSARLARYALRSQQNCLSQADVTSYESDVKWLEALAKGEVLPGGSTVPEKAPIVNDRVSTPRSTKEVARLKLKGYC